MRVFRQNYNEPLTYGTSTAMPGSFYFMQEIAVFAPTQIYNMLILNCFACKSGF
ncbi:MAG: hypothetical protein BWY83_00243 [bacterium ADurb.Bin478]|nr:MAG: hypothetical protein BWY83_00243 [bacterium ADurb.Bin478]